MNHNTFLRELQQGYRVAIGMTVTLLETLQDPNKRENTFSELKQEWNQRSQEWSEKGEVTEREAKETLENWLKKRQSSAPSASGNGQTIDTQAVSEENLEAEIRDLTQKITALRSELEKEQNSK